MKVRTHDPPSHSVRQVFARRLAAARCDGGSLPKSMRVRAGRTWRSLLLSHAEPGDPGCSGAAHGPALQRWRPASILANRGNKDFVCLARKAFAIFIEAAKTGIRGGRGRARGSRRPSFAMFAFRTGWSRWPQPSLHAITTRSAAENSGAVWVGPFFDHAGEACVGRLGASNVVHAMPARSVRQPHQALVRGTATVHSMPEAAIATRLRPSAGAYGQSRWLVAIFLYGCKRRKDIG
jgi:hypothetical protein